MFFKKSIKLEEFEDVSQLFWWSISSNSWKIVAEKELKCLQPYQSVSNCSPIVLSFFFYSLKSFFFLSFKHSKISEIFYFKQFFCHLCCFVFFFFDNCFPVNFSFWNLNTIVFFFFFVWENSLRFNRFCYLLITSKNRRKISV